jgi:hypothetical protein
MVLLLPARRRLSLLLVVMQKVDGRVEIIIMVMITTARRGVEGEAFIKKLYPAPVALPPPPPKV